MTKPVQNQKVVQEYVYKDPVTGQVFGEIPQGYSLIGPDNRLSKTLGEVTVTAPKNQQKVGSGNFTSNNIAADNAIAHEINTRNMDNFIASQYNDNNILSALSLGTINIPQLHSIYQGDNKVGKVLGTAAGIAMTPFQFIPSATTVARNIFNGVVSPFSSKEYNNQSAQGLTGYNGGLFSRSFNTNHPVISNTLNFLADVVAAGPLFKGSSNIKYNTPLELSQQAERVASTPRILQAVNNATNKVGDFVVSHPKTVTAGTMGTMGLGVAAQTANDALTLEKLNNAQPEKNAFQRAVDEVTSKIGPLAPWAMTTGAVFAPWIWRRFGNSKYSTYRSGLEPAAQEILPETAYGRWTLTRRTPTEQLVRNTEIDPRKIQEYVLNAKRQTAIANGEDAPLQLKALKGEPEGPAIYNQDGTPYEPIIAKGDKQQLVQYIRDNKQYLPLGPGVNPDKARQLGNVGRLATFGTGVTGTLWGQHNLFGNIFDVGNYSVKQTQLGGTPSNVVVNVDGTTTVVPDSTSVNNDDSNDNVGVVL